MGIKEIIQRLKEKKEVKKEMFIQAENQMRIQHLLEERQKSSNERELERFQREEREEAIKGELQLHRKMRDDEIKFGHNPLDTLNIMKSEWSILKEPNQFTGKSNMFKNEATVMRNSPNLLKNNMRLLR